MAAEKNHNIALILTNRYPAATALQLIKNYTVAALVLAGGTYIMMSLVFYKFGLGINIITIHFSS